jgi:hypothetical protein
MAPFVSVSPPYLRTDLIKVLYVSGFMNFYFFCYFSISYLNLIKDRVKAILAHPIELVALGGFSFESFIQV